VADEADRADIEVESTIAEARYLARAQAAMAPALHPRGTCHYCEETVSVPMLFCSADCAQDHANEDEQLRRCGRLKP
jgi:hypothetical protein